MLLTNNMGTNYTRRFVGEELIYELKIKDSKSKLNDLHTYCQNGYWCEWSIKNYNGRLTSVVSVTDDQCELIVFPTISDAEAGAKQFLSI